MNYPEQRYREVQPSRTEMDERRFQLAQAIRRSNLREPVRSILIAVVNLLGEAICQLERNDGQP